jgi:hypothetical protein
MRRTALAVPLLLAVLAFAPAAAVAQEPLAPIPPAATTACTPAPGPAPPGGVLCPEAPATIAGRAGCQFAPFNVVVRGHYIDSVSFALDDEPAQVVPAPNSATRYKFLVEMPRLLPGAHRVVATVMFTPESATPPLVLSTTFYRCVRAAAGYDPHADECAGLRAAVKKAKNQVKLAKKLRSRKLAKYQKRLAAARKAYNKERPRCPGRA